VIATAESARALADAVRSGRASARATTETARDRLRAAHTTTGALANLDDSGALEAAESVDAAVARGEDPGPLAGVPVVLKDNLCQRGRPCTCGSRLLEGYRAPYDAHVVSRLRAAGAVLLGRAHMDEFAMGSSTETCAWGPVRNPWDPSRVPGGSSGGSAALVAAGAVPVALGSDTGGSLRLPAAFCGLVGLNPTWGRVSRRGLVAFASSTDRIGPLVREVRDCARVAGVLAGPDPLDATCADRPVPDWEAACEQGVRGLSIGVPRAWLGDAETAVTDALEQALSALAAAGATVRDVPLPAPDLALAAYYVLAPAEASANLARFDGIRYGHRETDGDLEGLYTTTRGRGFGPEVRRRVLIGTWVLSAGYGEALYAQARRAREAVARGLGEALEQVDVLLTPPAPTRAFPLGTRRDPLAMYNTDRCTVPASLAGLPELAVPWGLADGLPVGVQVMARAFDEASCFRVAAAIEAAAAPLSPPRLWTAPGTA